MNDRIERVVQGAALGIIGGTILVMTYVVAYATGLWSQL